MNWATLVGQLGDYLQQSVNPAVEWTAALPTFVNNAELRIYRALDFLATRGQNTTLNFTIGNRLLSMATMTGQKPAGNMPLNSYPVVVQGVGAIVSGAIVRFVLTSVDFIDSAWPNQATTQAPSDWFAYYAMLDHQTIMVAPTPDQTYQAQVTGTWRPAPMSATNVQTWLGDNLPDLLFKACMVEAVGFQRDFGSQSDDPKMAMSWESSYQGALQSAIEEENRRKGQDPGWQPFSPTPISGSPRQ